MDYDTRREVRNRSVTVSEIRINRCGRLGFGDGLEGECSLAGSKFDIVSKQEILITVVLTDSGAQSSHDSIIRSCFRYTARRI